ncbi:MAG TPA: iron-sulfur cluster carrier protein ApbC [Candidatus Binatia bacterium]|jgi:ATP-binding protein involved in chromosome partitioning|nr:iron-sulfur cluster carrier protein ApbC [Candidatus Binatia bacterium]
MATPQELLEALKQVKYPGFSRDIVAFGMIKDIEVGGTSVTVQLAPSTDNAEVVAQIRQEVIATLAPLVRVPIEVVIQHSTAAPTRAKPEVPGVQYIVAVASGKGGVGKSTVAVNLALALSAIGQRVGILDADVYGPSVPLMLGINERPRSTEDKRLIPVSKYDLKVMSMGFLIPDGHAVVWRGPMIDKLLTEFIKNVEWGELDVLVVDLPPGTGDAQLTMVQKTPLSGGVIVTTPQDVALLDVRRGVKMFEEVHVPVLGVIENMSYHICSHCGHRAEIFSHGGGARMAEQFNVPFLGEIPLVKEIRTDGDNGTPLVVADPAHPQSQAFLRIAEQVVARLEEKARRQLTIH